VDRSALGYWESFSGGSRGWVAPIAPAAEDISHVERHVAGRSAPRALLLGVTQGLARMRWPARTSLVAADWSSAMIRHVWQPLPFAHAIRADWRELPLASASLDVVVGDGCWSAAGSYANAALVAREVQRVLKPGGLFCLRNTARPGLTPGDVVKELNAGKISNVFLFRWLLATAVQDASGDGVRLDDVWRAWLEVPHGLLRERGWLEDAEWAFGRWKGLGIRYWFPSPDELRALAAGFELVDYSIPAYDRGECFPSLVMARQKNISVAAGQQR
jgi:SAM-dependent methyltransferase